MPHRASCRHRYALMNGAKTGKMFSMQPTVERFCYRFNKYYYYFYIHRDWMSCHECAHIAETPLPRVRLTLRWINKIKFIFRKPAREKGRCVCAWMQQWHDHKQYETIEIIIKFTHFHCRMTSARFSHRIKTILYCTRRTIQLHSKLWKMCDTKWESLKKVSWTHVEFNFHI